MTNASNGDAYMTEVELESRLRTFPKTSLANLPTPLEEAPRLRAALGENAPRILIKRDDLTGFSFGGNKARHIEYRLPDILDKNADTLVLANPAQSNNVRVHVALGAKFGLDVFVVQVPSNKDHVFNGNLMLDELYGACVVPPSSTDQALARTRDLDNLATKLTDEGRTVYNVSRERFSKAAPPLSYMQATMELCRQLRELGAWPDHIFMAGSSSVSGVIVASKLLGHSYQIHPISVRDSRDDFAKDVCQSATVAIDLLELDMEVGPEDFYPHDEYIGPEWGVVTEGCMDALFLSARTESLVLDPVFTAKAMHALIDQIRGGQIGRDETVVFVHTGGQPITFAYADEIREFAGKSGSEAILNSD